MTKAIAVCAILYFAATQAAGQLVVTPFDPQRTHGSTSDPVLMAAADGKVLMRLNGSNGDEAPGFWSSVYVLDGTGRVLRRIDLPDEGTSFVVPFRQGFVARHYVESPQCDPPCGRYIPGRSELVYHDLSQPERQPVLIDRREGDILVLSSPDRKDLYLVSGSNPGEWVLHITRIDANLESAWSRSFSQLESGSVVATDDGVVFTQYKAGATTDYVLRAVGRNGEDRWEVRMPDRAPYGIKFVPSGYLAVPVSSRLSPYRVDAKTGRMLPDVSLPPAEITVPTRDGLLLVGPMLGQSYAAMVKADGTIAWMRRFNQDSNLRTFKDGIITSDGRLLLVAAGDYSSKFTFLSVDRHGEALERERSACLTVPSQDAMALSERLQGQSIHVVSPNAPPADPMYDPPAALRDGCPVVTESQYMAFMDALLSELPPATGRRARIAQVAVRLLESGEPPRLLSYGLAYGGWLPRGAYAEFLVPYDQGGQFARFFATDWQPHVKRMMALQDEFDRRTRFRYGARIKDASNYRQALADLEAAAVRLNEQIKAMPPEKLRYILEKPPVGDVSISLTPRGFGNGYTNDPYEERPLEDAVETLLHIVEEHRKQVAAGNIMISG
jgi:outer membrane protein assembly factor BamB